MKVVVQRTPGLHAFLIDNNKVVASAHGNSDLEAIGRLVATNPKKFNLKKVSAKRRPIEGLRD